MTGLSLIERAYAAYDFAGTVGVAAPELVLETPVAAPAPAFGASVNIDRERLAEAGFLLPGTAGPLAEEIRIAKRALLDAAAAGPASRAILVTSPRPGDGKSFAALNLALSMAAEQDVEVLLVDADIVKPALPDLLGIAPGPGLMDALTGKVSDAEALIVRTDIPGLSILSAGARAANDAEALASNRAEAVLKRLLDANPARIVLFDSPPLLAASHAAALARHAGQVLVVVRADRTSEADLGEAIGLLGASDKVKLLLNAVTLAPGGRRFAGYGEDA